jgi:hypothetical protein
MAGIPINAVLNKFDRRDKVADRHKFHPRLKKNDIPSLNDEAAFVIEYVENVEKDFADEAESILERLQLSHLRQKTKKYV